MNNQLVPANQLPDEDQLVQRYLTGQISLTVFLYCIRQLINEGRQLSHEVIALYDELSNSQALHDLTRAGSQLAPYVRDAATATGEIVRTGANDFVNYFTPAAASSQPTTITPYGPNNQIGPQRPAVRVQRTIFPEESSLSNSQPAETMDTTNNPTMPLRAAPQTATTVQTRNVTQADNMKNHFPYHNTTQALQSYRANFSVNKCQYDGETNNIFTCRMNTHKDMVSDNTLIAQTDFTTPVQGLSLQNIGRYIRLNRKGEPLSFPYHRDLSTHKKYLTTTGVPTMWKYYNDIWMSYTILKADWKLKLHFPYHYYTHTNEEGETIPSALTALELENGSRDPGDERAIRVFTHYTVEGDSIGALNNMPIGQSTSTMEDFYTGYDNKITIRPNETKTITGTWYPGKVKHNVLNESDIDTWTATGTAPTSGHLEKLVVEFKEHELSNKISQDYASSLNCEFEVVYTVQYKDLIKTMQWPVQGGAAFTEDLVLTQTQDYNPA